ncbi:MAG: V-type ATP synthase subunit E [Betaproteobacteria bacterium]|nr:V-type ATP synthase subunit E [Betaproteobacteria bacterium]
MTEKWEMTEKRVMEADAQVTQLEAALIHQAETLAREQRQNAESARTRILKEAAERLKLAEEREVLAAKAEAERRMRRQVQAAETRLAGELDRQRWALTEATLSGVRLAFQDLADDDARYLKTLEHWLAAAAKALPAGDLVVEMRAADQPRLAPVQAEMVQRAAPGRGVAWVVSGLHSQTSEGGIRVRLADNRAQLDQTFEARQSRLADDLARVAMERLFASAPDLSVLAR